MAAQQDLPQVPNTRFRVLIIGRANAGKTTILKKICDTTESPEIIRVGPSGTRDRVQLDHRRGLHNIDDELTFSNHDGYVFHDSRGFEPGSEEELKIVQDFTRRKSQEERLEDRVHIIWYCIPMDGNRPSLDIRHFDNICPDKNVPVIAVFTKFDQFRRNIRMKLDDANDHGETDLDTEVEAAFSQDYLGGFTKRPPFVRLENMHKQGRCTDLIEMTANELGNHLPGDSDDFAAVDEVPDRDTVTGA